MPGGGSIARGAILAGIVTFRRMPIELIALTGATLMVATGVLTPRSPVRALNRNILAVIAGSVHVHLLQVPQPAQPPVESDGDEVRRLQHGGLRPIRDSADRRLPDHHVPGRAGSGGDWRSGWFCQWVGAALFVTTTEGLSAVAV